MSTPYPHFDLEVHYPESDGEPMAESDFQLEPLMYAVQALRTHFQAHEDIYVSGNMFIYYEEGNPKRVVAPDVFVILGAEKHARPSYKLWQEPKAPDFVLEITSKSTRSQDQGSKRGIYAFLGVQEYWQFDPTGDYLTPPLQGLHLVDKNYQDMPRAIATGGVISMRSEVLRLDLRCEDGTLRFYDPDTQRYLLYHNEAEQARLQAEQTQQQAELAQQQAEQAQQEAELAQQQAEQAQQQAELAQQQAEQAQQEAEKRADQEATARQAAENQIAELEARLRALQAGQKPDGDGE